MLDPREKQAQLVSKVNKASEERVEFVVLKVPLESKVPEAQTAHKVQRVPEAQREL